VDPYGGQWATFIYALPPWLKSLVTPLLVGQFDEYGTHCTFKKMIIRCLNLEQLIFAIT